MTPCSVEYKNDIFEEFIITEPNGSEVYQCIHSQAGVCAVLVRSSSAVTVCASEPAAADGSETVLL